MATQEEFLARLERIAVALETHCGAQLKLDHDALAREVNTEVIVGQEMDIQRLRAENAALRGRVAAFEAEAMNGCGWPTPQPIETAPLGHLLAWDSISGEWVVTTGYVRRSVHTAWLPMPPPPPGGG